MGAFDDTFGQVQEGLQTMQAWSITCLVTVTLSTLLRVYVRRHLVQLFGLEDWLMVAASIFCVVLQSTALSTIRLCHRLLTGDLEALDRVNVLSRAAYGFYVLALLFVKLSLGFFFLRVLRHHALQVAIIYGLLALTVTTSSIYWGLTTFTCAQFRDISPILGHCEWQRTANISNTVFTMANIIASSAFAAMAVIALVSSKMPKSTKLVASLLLILGSSGSVASVIRISLVLQKMDPIRIIPQYFAGGLWLVVEVSTAIVAANLALTRHFFQACWQQVRRLGLKQSSKGMDPACTETKSQALQGAQTETLVWIENNIVLSAFGTDGETTKVLAGRKVTEAQVIEADSSDLERGDSTSKEAQ